MLDRISVRGARQHNLRDLHLEIPRNSFTVVTGLSGSGKSSLAFDTIYAEGQRRYVETLSPYARQFLDQMERPDVDSIDGLSPALSIEQKTTARSPRSTVGTVTEIYDYLRLLYSSVGAPYCHKCDLPIQRQSAELAASRILEDQLGKKVMVMTPFVQGRKGHYRKELQGFAAKGFVRARIDGEMMHLEDDILLDRRKAHTIEIVVDRVHVRKGVEQRLQNSIRTASQLGGGLVLIAEIDGPETLYSEKLACTGCGAGLPDFEPRSFSFNSRYGACPACHGLGSIWDFDLDKLILDPAKPAFDGALPPTWLWWHIVRDVEVVAKAGKIDLRKPWRDLPRKDRDLLLFGAGEDETLRSVRGFTGILHQIRSHYGRNAAEEQKEHVLKYMSPQTCSACGGRRLKPESLAVRVAGLSIAEMAALPLNRLAALLGGLDLSERQRTVADRLTGEIRKRLRFLENVGLAYLSLDRSSATLSGGEAQRVRLATQLGTELRGVLYVLDEPSIGLHPRDNGRLLDNLARLRDLGNTIVVVEHDRETIERADHVVDLGPRAGRLGGGLVAQGTPAQVSRAKGSLTGEYLSGRKAIETPARRRPAAERRLTVRGARRHNLKNITVEFPLGALIVVTGVSGSGKSTLVNDVLYPVLAKQARRGAGGAESAGGVEGLQWVDKVIRIDQSPIGRTPRSNPATYTQALTPIRNFFADLPESRARGYKPGRFSFNVKGGRCEACRGDGNKRIEMNFLPDVFVRCDVCRGRRYNQETLQVKYKGRSIADLLEATVEEALPVLENFPAVHPKLKTLGDVGLGYIHLGQSSTTLSGGEAQRIKLARELSKRQTGKTVYILDEPTTGLHFDDVRNLLEVLRKLAGLGNTVIVIEHNLDVVKSADWIVDLGPEGGEEGGEVVAAGTPEDIARAPASHTGRELGRIGIG